LAKAPSLGSCDRHNMIFVYVSKLDLTIHCPECIVVEKSLDSKTLEVLTKFLLKIKEHLRDLFLKFADI